MNWLASPEPVKFEAGMEVWDGRHDDHVILTGKVVRNNKRTLYEVHKANNSDDIYWTEATSLYQIEHL